MEKHIDNEIRIIFNLIRHRINESDKLQCIGEKVTHRQGAVIAIIKNSKTPVFQKDIERELRIRRSTATQMLKDMEKNGLITRQAVDNDMRLKKLVLTEAATQIFYEVHDELLVVEDTILQGFNEQDKEILYKYLDKIKDNLCRR